MRRIETERLIVRGFRPTDGRDLFEYLSLPDTYRFEPGDPIDWKRAAELAEERSRSDDFLAVEAKDSGRMIGHLYFARMERAEFLAWELGYIFNPAFQGKGFCTEAARAAVSHAFAELGAHRVNAYCDPRNPASWRVLEKIGLRREGLFPKKAFFRRDAEGNPLWHDCLAYGILDEDWNSGNGGER